MAKEPREILQESDLFLRSKETAMPLNGVLISPLKKTSSRTNLKLSCSSDAKSSENMDEDIFLASKATSTPLADGSISPMKNNEPETIFLFRARIPVLPQESPSSSMPLTDVTVSPTKKRSRTSMMQDGFCLGSNPQEMCLFSASPMKTDNENLKTPFLFNAEFSENPREELKEGARKIKKMKRIGVSTELDLNTPPCTIRKVLTASDVGHLSKIMLERSHAEVHILHHLSADDQRKIQGGEGVEVQVYDHDTNTEHSLVLKRMVNTTKSYVLNSGWVKYFVGRRNLEKGHEIGLF